MVQPRRIGRYLLDEQIAAGGMASVHFGRLSGHGGFGRTVAIKRLLSPNSETRTMLLDEGRTSSFVQHPNVVQTLDVLNDGDEVFLVLEYVHGISLDHLFTACLRTAAKIPTEVSIAIVVGALRGLQAAHEAVGADGLSLELVHRDLSPHNILVDTHGLAKVSDFGIAKARGREQRTGGGAIRGKLSYLAPEQLDGNADRRSDLYAMGIVLWECLASGKRLFDGASDAEVMKAVMLAQVPRLEATPRELAHILTKALAYDPADRYSSATEMADALERASPVASHSQVAEFITSMAGEVLTTRQVRLRTLQSSPAESEAPIVPTEQVSHPRDSRRVVVGLGLAAAATLAGLIAWNTWPRPLAQPEVLRPSVSPPAAEVVEVNPPLPPSSDSPAQPAAVASPIQAIDKPVPNRRLTGPRRRGSPKKVPGSGKAAGCDPPYVIDARGDKRYKVECL